MLQLLTDMLDKGSTTYHYPVLRLLHEYMKLQDPDNIEIKKISNLVITATTRHIKVHVAESFNVWRRHYQLDTKLHITRWY